MPVLLLLFYCFFIAFIDNEPLRYCAADATLLAGKSDLKTVVYKTARVIEFKAIALSAIVKE